MLENIEFIKPADIEKRSMEIISGMLADRSFPATNEPVIKRVIHTTADFDYADILKFSPGAVEKGLAALREGCGLVTDTKMAAAGINKKAIARLGGQVNCFMEDVDVAGEASARGVTRAAVCMEKAAKDAGIRIYVIGNAPTALIRLYELIREGAVAPALVIGVPVGFVNVVEAKELFMTAGVPYIISEGRKGGSNVAAAIVNALLYIL